MCTLYSGQLAEKGKVTNYLASTLHFAEVAEPTDPKKYKIFFFFHLNFGMHEQIFFSSFCEILGDIVVGLISHGSCVRDLEVL